MLSCTCPASCCAPNPAFDCTVDIESSRPGDWLLLKDTCDNQGSCSVPNLGGLLTECGTDVNSDYLQVFFECLPLDDGNSAVGFTAVADQQSYIDISLTTVIPYKTAITNYGGHYNEQTYSFICPVHGLYSFTASIMCQNDFIRAAIYRNSELLVTTEALDENNGFPSASTSVVTECNAGDVVWVNTEIAGVLHAFNRNDVFSGFLFYQF